MHKRLRSPAGATVPAIMKATSWQRHSVHEALAARLLSDATRGMDLGRTISIEASLRIARRGVETKLVIEADGAAVADRAPEQDRKHDE